MKIASSSFRLFLNYLRRFRKPLDKNRILHFSSVRTGTLFVIVCILCVLSSRIPWCQSRKDENSLERLLRRPSKVSSSSSLRTIREKAAVLLRKFLPAALSSVRILLYHQKHELLKLKFGKLRAG